MYDLVFKQLMQLTEFFLNIIIQQSPDFSAKAVDLAAGELLEIATPGKGFLLVNHPVSTVDWPLSFIFLCPPFFLPPVVTQEELDRAKEATKSAVLMNLESRVHCSWS